jgi:hypothetical protein
VTLDHTLTIGRLHRLLFTRHGTVGSWTEWLGRREFRYAPVILEKGSLFFLVSGPHTGTRSTYDKAVLAEVLCDTARCIILLTPDAYELVGVEK